MSERDYIRELNRREREYYNSLPEEKYAWWFNIALACHWLYSLLGWAFPLIYSADTPYLTPKPTLFWLSLIIYTINTVVLFKTEDFWLCYVIPKEWWMR